MKTKVQVDRQKAKALMKMADQTLARLKETDLEKYPSNTLTDYYDIVRKIKDYGGVIPVKRGKGKRGRSSSGADKLHLQRTWL